MRRRLFLSGLSLAALGLLEPCRAESSAGDVLPYQRRLASRLADGGGGRAAPAVEEALLSLHNALRTSIATPLLALDEDLARAARAHAADLLERAYFAHEAPEGFSGRERVAILARRFLGASGENLAAEEGGEPPTAARLMDLWRSSPGHLANMTRARWSHVGFSVLRRDGRSVAAAVFGERYARLREPAPWTARPEDVPGLLAGASAPLIGYRLQGVGGGAGLGPFARGEPALGASGVYLLRPHAPAATPSSYFVLYGPMLAVRDGSA